MSEKDGGWPMVTPLHPWELAGDLSQSEKKTYCWGLCGKPVSQGRKLRTCSSSKTYSVSLVQIHIYICIIITMITMIIIINNNNINIHIYIYTRYIHTIHYTTLHLHYIKLHLHYIYITLHYLTLHYITLHYIHTCTCICASHSNDHWSWCWINLFKIASFPFVVPQCQTFCSTAGMLFFWPPTNFGTIRASRT